MFHRPLPAPRLAPPRATWALIAAATLAGCASTSPDAALALLQQQLQQRTGARLQAWPDAQAPSAEARQRIQALLAEPLERDGAVELALLQHRGLQAALADLGVTQAELAQATRLPNPGFSFKRTRSGEEVEWERGLHLSLARLLLMPLTRSLDQGRLAQQQAQTTLRVVEHIATVRRTWVDAVAAEESLHYLQQVHAAAEAGAELARRMVQAGNFNALALAREQGYEADAALNLARGTQARDAARERLARALGLDDRQLGYRLPERLPDLPDQPTAASDDPELLPRALAQRLDVQAAKTSTEQTARALGLTRATRFVSVLDVGATRANTNTDAHSHAWEVALELPLFDWGDARVARAEALYSASLHRTAEVALNARSELREAYGQYHHAWRIAQHLQTTLVPIKQRTSEQNLLRYNGMLIGVFELLADARAQVASVNSAIEARRDFWRAEADWQMAQLGRPLLDGSGAAAASASSTAAADGGGH